MYPKQNIKDEKEKYDRFWGRGVGGDGGKKAQ